MKHLWIFFSLAGITHAGPHVLRATDTAPENAASPPAPTSPLVRRKCVDTTFTGELIGYYNNPSCGFDEFRCAAGQIVTTSGAIFDCASSSVTSHTFTTSCNAGTLYFGTTSRVCGGLSGGVCNPLRFYTDSEKPPFLSWTCGPDTKTTLYANSEQIPGLTTTTSSRRSSGTSTASTTTTSTTTTSASQTISNVAGANTSPAAVAEQGQGQGSSAPIGAIVGGSVGGAAVLVMAIVAGFFLRRRRLNKDDSEAAAAGASVQGETGKAELGGDSAAPTPLVVKAETEGKPEAVVGTAELASTRQTSPPVELGDAPKTYELDGASAEAPRR